ncbi:hypothetical protein [Alteromonas lipolytica]|uniref:SGNH hydrolase-type esterase domain-containing protein n=1 Tax=Alteromonas lipolytica TaxID=1856405 RepID=A0A1E8FGY9_9ALTE|nr:hypothetical protein [Alteromonas lipolytica]OFI35191.1 hypothetical protein BFC17_16760 [Alteromonas lipolytica]GGF57492.1 hypothetical protein GCM10011338_07170 [Alteromonas lipolytica]
MARTYKERRASIAIARGETKDYLTYRRMMRTLSEDRINIVTQGDSWFDFPRIESLSLGPANIIDWLVSMTNFGDGKLKKCTFYRLEENGEEIATMSEREELEDLIDALEVPWDIHYVLLSGGGNDFTGFEHIHDVILKEPKGAINEPESWINDEEFNLRLKQVELSFSTIINKILKYKPDSRILSHTYDYLMPSDVGVELLRRVDLSSIFSGPWVSPGMSNIPENLRLSVVKLMIDRFVNVLETVKQSYPNNFDFADLRNTLTPGDQTHWLNEMHPTSKGFEMLAVKLLEKLPLLQN